MSCLNSTMRKVSILLLSALLCGGCATTVSTGRVGERSSCSLTESEMRVASALARFCRGLLFEGMEDKSGRADAEFENVIELDPSQPEISLRLARKYYSTGRTNDAVRVLRQGCERHPDDFAMKLFLAYAYQVSGMNDLALAEYRRIVKLEPGNCAGYVGEAQIYFQKRDEEKAFSALEDGLHVCTNATSMIQTCRQLGSEYAIEERWAQAIRCFRMVQSKLPNDLGSKLGLFQVYLNKGDKGRAMAELKGMPSKYTDNPRYYFVLARSYIATENYAEAAASLEEAEKRLSALPVATDDFRDSVFYYFFGMACERLGQAERAEKLFEKSIQLDGNNDKAQNYLAYMWAERGSNLDKALDYVKRAIQVEPANAAYADTLGWVYFKQNRLELALDQIIKAARLMPDDPTITEHLGDLYKAKNDVKLAIDQWKMSFVLDMENKAVARKLTDHGVDLGKLRREARAAGKKKQPQMDADEHR